MYRHTGIGPDDLISFLISDWSGEYSVTTFLERAALPAWVCRGAMPPR
jgi:hypothetical protein